MKTIVRSLNEIYAMLKKAAVGSGCDHGIAEELGRAAVWLSATGHDGVDALQTALNSGSTRIVPPRIEHSIAVFQDAKASVAGPATLDILLSDQGLEKVRIENVDVPLLVLGVAGFRAAEAGRAISVEIDGVVENVESCNAARLKPGSDMTLILGAPRSLRTGAERPRGAEVNAAAWAACESLAARTYVPATEQSRVRGAGASLTDND